MNDRNQNGAGRFIVPAKIKLKLNLTLTGPFAEQLRQWAEKWNDRFKDSPWRNHERELRAEQRRLAIMLLEEAVGACSASGLPIGDAFTQCAIAPRMEVVAGPPRRIEQLEMLSAARGGGLGFFHGRRN